MRITSTANDNIKHVRALQAKSRARRNANQFVIEGVNLLEEALETGTPIDEIYYTEGFAEDGDALLLALSETGAPLIPVSAEVMEAISDTQSPQGILAVLPTPTISPTDEITLALVIDGVSDPGNMGTIMRSAVGAGIDVMIVTTGTVDLTNPKVVRSAMGAHFRLPVQRLSWEGIASRYGNHILFLAEPSGGAPHHSIDWTQPAVLIVSDETQGPSEDAARLAHVRVSIPMAGGFDSLNVAVAASVMMFEAVRQRREAQ
ncbi:MAG: RNA methyltransferase [Chloroflexi bacterium]|nr:RNA methyltransferase [Chloroflexota bacterium]